MIKRIISITMATVLAISSYMPSYAAEMPESEVNDDIDAVVEAENEEEREVELVQSDKNSEDDLSDVENTDEIVIEPDDPGNGSDTVTEEPSENLVSDDGEVVVPISYRDGITFSNPDRQPPTSITWNGETDFEFTVPVPDIPEGYKLNTLNAAAKTDTGYINLPAEVDAENSAYTFTCHFISRIDLEIGIIVYAEFSMIYDGEQDTELEIPIRYSINYSFPDSMPKSVKGKEGEKIFFRIPYPDPIDGCELNMILCFAESVKHEVINSLYGRDLKKEREYLFEYTVSKEDIVSGISVQPDFKDIIDVVFEESEHGEHVFFGGAAPTFHLDQFFWADVQYPGISILQSHYYIPDHGYKLEALYYSEEMDESSLLYTPGQGQGTQLKSSMLSEDNKLHVYAKWVPLTASIVFGVGDINSGYTVTYNEVFPDFSKGSGDIYYNQNGGKKVEIIPGVNRFDESIDYDSEFDDFSGDLSNFKIYVYPARSSFYNVTFDTDSDTIINPIKVCGGESIDRPEIEISKEGCYLTGWYTDPAFSNLFTFGKTKISKDTTLYAKWEPVEYAVTFHSNFGKDATVKKTYKYSEKDDEKNKGTIKAGDIFTSLSAKEGFSGWMSSDDLEIAPETTKKELIDILEDKLGTPSRTVGIHLYAQWSETAYYTVTLLANIPADAKVSNLGGSLAEFAKAKDNDNPYVKQKVYTDKIKNLTGDEYTLNGFTLSGWEYINDKGKKVTLKPSATLKNLAAEGGEVTVKATWKKLTYKITYNFNGGNAGKNRKSISYSYNESTKDGVPLYNYKKDGSSYVLKDPDTYQTDVWDVVKTGYEFKGWAFGDTEYTYYGDDVYQNLTLTAVWAPRSYKVKFVDTDGSEIYKIEDAKFDTPYPLNEYEVSRDGNIFKGWEGIYKKKVKLLTANKELVLKNLDMPENGIYVLTARFAPVTYKITYKLKGGKIGSKPSSYVFGKGSTKAVPNPKRDGYAFAGWTVENAGNGADINSVIDPDTKKITAETFGNIELTANWIPYKYDIRFCKADGTVYDSADNALGSYLGLEYTENVDFTAAAMYIESLAGFDENKSVKGFALSTTAKKPKYALYKKYSKLGAKSDNTVLDVYPVLTGKVQRVNYTVTLMPNAKDVKERDDSAEFIKNGIKYVAKVDENNYISEFAYNTTAEFKAPEWKRHGYDLVGFGTSSKAKVPVKSLKELGNGRQTDVKLYAIWEKKTFTITYSKYVHVYDPFRGYKFMEVPAFEGKTTLVYKGKDVTLKKVSLEGYVFKGWIYSSGSRDKLSTYPMLFPGWRNDSVLIKKVLKDNYTDLALEAVFGWGEYSLVLDPCGGIYDGRKVKSSYYTVGCYDDVSSILDEFYTKAERDGYVLSGLSTSKNGKNRLSVYDDEGNLQEISSLSMKNGATVVIYPIWKKVSPKTPGVSATLSDPGDGSTVLKMTSTSEVRSNKGSLVFEYSTSPLFIFGVKRVVVNAEDIDDENPDAVNSVTVDNGISNRTYYVRVKYGEKDSTGKYSYGKFSKITSAARFTD